MTITLIQQAKSPDKRTDSVINKDITTKREEKRLLKALITEWSVSISSFILTSSAIVLTGVLFTKICLNAWHLPVSTALNADWLIC
jgi:hypothetical protein